MRYFILINLIYSLVAICASSEDFSKIIDCTTDHNNHRKSVLRTDHALSQSALDLAKTAVSTGKLSETNGINFFVYDQEDHDEIEHDSEDDTICEMAVGDWFSKAITYNSLATDKELKDKLKTHKYYTQMVWRSTRQVGCAYAHNLERLVVVCKYSPSGNDPNKLRTEVPINSKEKYLMDGKLEDLCKIKNPRKDLVYEKTQDRYEKIIIENRIKEAKEKCESSNSEDDKSASQKIDKNFELKESPEITDGLKDDAKLIPAKKVDNAVSTEESKRKSMEDRRKRMLERLNKNKPTTTTTTTTKKPSVDAEKTDENGTDLDNDKPKKLGLEESKKKPISDQQNPTIPSSQSSGGGFKPPGTSNTNTNTQSGTNSPFSNVRPQGSQSQTQTTTRSPNNRIPSFTQNNSPTINNVNPPNTNLRPGAQSTNPSSSSGGVKSSSSGSGSGTGAVDKRIEELEKKVNSLTNRHKTTTSRRRKQRNRLVPFPWF